MTIRRLKDMAITGEPLPNLVILPGRLSATGPPVKAITPQIEELEPLLGKIDQQKNFYID
jgi:hypothetical protein